METIMSKKATRHSKGRRVRPMPPVVEPAGAGDCPRPDVFRAVGRGPLWALVALVSISRSVADAFETHPRKGVSLGELAWELALTPPYRQLAGFPGGYAWEGFESYTSFPHPWSWVGEDDGVLYLRTPSLVLWIEDGELHVRLPADRRGSLDEPLLRSGWIGVS